MGGCPWGIGDWELQLFVGRAHVLFTLVYVCIFVLFVFVLCTFVAIFSGLSFFFIVPSVFSNVYLAYVYTMLLDSLDCTFLIAPSVFSNVYF